MVYSMKNPIIDKGGVKRWYNSSGQLHRTDGPAIITSRGSEHWYQNDERHRTDGPAIILWNGSECWYIKGKPIKPIPKHIILWKKKLNG